jgi:hypothetical protein
MYERGIHQHHLSAAFLIGEYYKSEAQSKVVRLYKLFLFPVPMRNAALEETAAKDDDQHQAYYNRAEPEGSLEHIVAFFEWR